MNQRRIDRLLRLPSFTLVVSKMIMPFVRNEARERNKAQRLPHRYSSVIKLFFVGVMDFKETHFEISVCNNYICKLFPKSRVPWVNERLARLKIRPGAYTLGSRLGSRLRLILTNIEFPHHNLKPKPTLAASVCIHCHETPALTDHNFYLFLPSSRAC
jgi:hypothetical protein